MHDPPDNQNLEETLRLAADGDEDAWRLVVDVYGPRVFALVRAQCGDPELAEEITQSAFCTIAAKIGSYAELGKFEAWIFRIAMNRLRDEMRRRRRQARPVEDQALTGLAGPAENPQLPGEGVEPAELRALRDGLSQLSEHEQRIIHLRWHGLLSFKQIAETLEQPLGTVLARHHRALKRLREILGEGE
jgi:RNA polymerase sigma-70 factor, ECF subfamily